MKSFFRKKNDFLENISPIVKNRIRELLLESGRGRRIPSNQIPAITLGIRPILLDSGQDSANLAGFARTAKFRSFSGLPAKTVGI
jgi:hypothetical protein